MMTDTAEKLLNVLDAAIAPGRRIPRLIPPENNEVTRPVRLRYTVIVTFGGYGGLDLKGGDIIDCTEEEAGQLLFRCLAELLEPFPGPPAPETYER